LIRQGTAKGGQGNPSPGRKLLFAILVGVLLAIPLFTVWLLIYDRQSQSVTAEASIAQGWGGPQSIAGPLLVIPFLGTVRETAEEGGTQVTRSRQIWQELVLAPDAASITTDIRPEVRKRAIYEAVVYEAGIKGSASFSMPDGLDRLGVDQSQLALDRAELRFGLRDARGLFGPPPKVVSNGAALALQPGHGPEATAFSGFFAWIDAKDFAAKPIDVNFNYQFRGNNSLGLLPQAGDTRWTVRSGWPHPSFQGGFLPVARDVTDKGFSASYQIGNLALGTSLVTVASPIGDRRGGEGMDLASIPPTQSHEARITLIQPVDLYSKVSRAAKYGFLFIGLTFLTLLMFDILGGVRVSNVHYLLVGAALILFFVLLLALAEIIGFTPAYLVASATIIGLVTAYSAAVLESWRRAVAIGGLLLALYAVLYVLLSLEAYALLIGALMLLVALASVMYLTRRLDWTAASADRTGAAA